MSEQNVAIVRAMFEGGAGASMESILAALNEALPLLFDPDVEWVETPERADALVYRGHDGVRKAFERYFEQWDDYSGDLEGVEDHGDQVLAIVQENARGVASGVPVKGRLFTVFTFRDGKIVRYLESYDEATAREELES